MTKIAEILGQRVRYFRKKKKLSQEELAELADLHPTYIGQIERGEKNASIETIYKISSALEIPLVQLLEKIDEYSAVESRSYTPKFSVSLSANIENIPLQAYELFSSESADTQKKLFNLLNCALMLKMESNPYEK